MQLTLRMPQPPCYVLSDLNARPPLIMCTEQDRCAGLHTCAWSACAVLSAHALVLRVPLLQLALGTQQVQAAHSGSGRKRLLGHSLTPHSHSHKCICTKHTSGLFKLSPRSSPCVRQEAASVHLLASCCKPLRNSPMEL